MISSTRENFALIIESGGARAVEGVDR
ncbi:MAG: hypothetical protein QOD04_5556, partial [Pseudonocardiales bacterium]|nr:hypothetical protein [Pseudonocardiales bacterium]